MHPTADDVTRTVLREARDALDESVTKIRHCLNQLSEEQVWWRPHDSMNSIGNLILHLAGNARQWMVSGLGGSADVRDRPSEFSQRSSVPKAALLENLEQVVRETTAVFDRLSAVEMSTERKIQGFSVTGWNALFHCIPHFKGHTQEIISLTRMQLKEGYQFHWQPKTPEQGAASGAR